MRKLFIPSKENGYKPLLLRKIALVAYTVILLIVNTFGGFLGIPEAMASTITPSNIINLTNQQRAAAGLNTLSTNAKLSAAAQAKANNMFEVQYWDHFGPNGETPWMFITQAGYTYVYAGENLAKGFRTAEGVHEAWMASPTHRENIMSNKYKEIGVAVVEGNLLGTDVILVVQMFGNQTNEIFSLPPTVKSEVTPTPKPVVKETGEIKSIRITNPKTGELIDDANVNIKGETSNVSGAYSVEITNSDEVVGETSSSTPTWEFDKVSDWEEGEHSIQAQIKGEDVKSETVTFTIDSTPPEIKKESIAVRKTETSFELKLVGSTDITELKLVTGDKTFDLEVAEDGTATLNIPIEDIGKTSVLMASDVAGNIYEIDISEYFLEGDEEEATTGTSNLLLWLKNMVGTTDGISLSIIIFVFILLSVEVYVYWRKGKLGKNAGELFTVGAWWLIILVGVFKGFSGIVS
ncbi:hypothetical protein A2436_00190 [candidate division WS6 bacterium RIFOXYC1_FULL_33_9]|nr:MAG: hypothetical protein UR45_C0002G0044 [candidate division WS6 bacterium GW2011_WS6_33_547]KKP57234.1 MAG: hypothetical protein UR49_C0001G0007 [candidate division WS6 bacterium GW2011_GWF2_33_92]OGC35986.1 MAG: hypothetical protein A2369_02765 [candidate division WS6 bacterium RIFOXYB1_FULL_33_15]OGC36916.1 MAG: hypothetical protein A2436_00190 [candidate division WS6 bacterium RIFOXYC1_FULL_33_9]